MYKWIILMSGLFASLTACAKVKLWARLNSDITAAVYFSNL